MANTQDGNNFFSYGLIDIISLLIGLENMQLNISANDLDEQTGAILDDLHTYLAKLDKHLELQDEHLLHQDLRIARLEQVLKNNTIGNGVTEND